MHPLPCTMYHSMYPPQPCVLLHTYSRSRATSMIDSRCSFLRPCCLRLLANNCPFRSSPPLPGPLTVTHHTHPVHLDRHPCSQNVPKRALYVCEIYSTFRTLIFQGSCRSRLSEYHNSHTRYTHTDPPTDEERKGKDLGVCLGTCHISLRKTRITLAWVAGSFISAQRP
jgi:hypothetical protein